MLKIKSSDPFGPARFNMTCRCGAPKVERAQNRTVFTFRHRCVRSCYRVTWVLVFAFCTSHESLLLSSKTRSNGYLARRCLWALFFCAGKFGNIDICASVIAACYLFWQMCVLSNFLVPSRVFDIELHFPQKWNLLLLPWTKQRHHRRLPHEHGIAV